MTPQKSQTTKAQISDNNVHTTKHQKGEKLSLKIAAVYLLTILGTLFIGGLIQFIFKKITISLALPFPIIWTKRFPLWCTITYFNIPGIILNIVFFYYYFAYSKRRMLLHKTYRPTVIFFFIIVLLSNIFLNLVPQIFDSTSFRSFSGCSGML